MVSLIDINAVAYCRNWVKCFDLKDKLLDFDAQLGRDVLLCSENMPGSFKNPRNTPIDSAAGSISPTVLTC